MQHDEDNKVDGIVLVTEAAKKFLNPKQEPDFHIYTDKGGDPTQTEKAWKTATYRNTRRKGTLAFSSKREKKFVDYREGLVKSQVSNR